MKRLVVATSGGLAFAATQRNNPCKLQADSKPVLDYRLLAKIGPFASLSTDQLRDFAAHSAVERLDARKMFRPSNTDGPICVLHGSLKTIRTRKSGRTMIVNFLGPGDVFNVFAVPKSDIAYQTLEETLIIRVGRDEFAAAVIGEHWRSVAPGLERIMAPVFKALDHYNSLFGQPLRFRLAKELVMMAERFGVKDAGGTLIKLAVTNNDLAAFIGCSPRQLDALLGEFHKQGLLQRDGRRLIVNIEGLQEIVDAH